VSYSRSRAEDFASGFVAAGREIPLQLRVDLLAPRHRRQLIGRQRGRQVGT